MKPEKLLMSKLDQEWEMHTKDGYNQAIDEMQKWVLSVIDDCKQQYVDYDKHKLYTTRNVNEILQELKEVIKGEK